MFHKKINEIFSGMPNVFHSADDIFIVGFEEKGKDNDETSERIL